MAVPREFVAQELLHALAPLAARWCAGELAAPCMAALYFLHWQIATHGDAFASRKSKNDPRPQAASWVAALRHAAPEDLRTLLLDCLGRYQFHGVIANVPATLVQWLRGNWPLELREDVLSPIEVLRTQARGTRAVTAIMAWPRMLEPVLTKPNAFAFFLHDVEHAYKFFNSPELYAGQKMFFAALETALDGGVFAQYLDEPTFREKFHYLMSDMNTHPQHSRQYLRAILIEFYLRRDGKPSTAPLPPAAQRAIESALRTVEPPALLAVSA